MIGQIYSDFFAIPVEKGMIVGQLCINNHVPTPFFLVYHLQWDISVYCFPLSLFSIFFIVI